MSKVALSHDWWPHQTMAWAQRDLTSSLSIVIALAACLSATTSEGRKRGGPGTMSQCWGDPQDHCGCLDAPAWVCSSCRAQLLPSPRGVQLRVPACVSLLIPELLHRRLNFRAGLWDLISAAMLPALLGLPCKGSAAACRGGCRGDRDAGTISAMAIPVTRAGGSAGPCGLARGVAARERVGGHRRVCGGCRGLKGHSGGELVMRGKAGNFQSGKQGFSQGPSPNISVSATSGLLLPP